MIKINYFGFHAQPIQRKSGLSAAWMRPYHNLFPGAAMDEQKRPDDDALWPEAAVMRAGMEAYVGRINGGDCEGVLALFAPDAVIEDPVGTAPKSGIEIRQWFADTIAFGTQIHPVAPIRGSHANAAALTFEVTFQPSDGPALRIRSMDVCTFDQAGRITSLRAYWGPEDVEVVKQ